MVKVKFFALIRSNHRIAQMEVESGSLKSIINTIKTRVPTLSDEEIDNAVIFINQRKVMHQKRYDEILKDGDELIFTNFVGGG